MPRCIATIQCTFVTLNAPFNRLNLITQNKTKLNRNINIDKTTINDTDITPIIIIILYESLCHAKIPRKTFPLVILLSFIYKLFKTKLPLSTNSEW